MSFFLEKESIFTRCINAIVSHQAKCVLEAVFVAARQDMDHGRSWFHVPVHHDSGPGEVIDMLQNVVGEEEIKLRAVQDGAVRREKAAVREPAHGVVNSNRADIGAANSPVSRERRAKHFSQDTVATPEVERIPRRRKLKATDQLENPLPLLSRPLVHVTLPVTPLVEINGSLLVVKVESAAHKVSL